MIEEDGALVAHHRPLRQIAFERFEGLAGDRHLALLAALAADAQPALGAVEILQVEPVEFADAQAAAVEQFENRAVAHRVWAIEIVGGHPVDERVHLLRTVMTSGSVLGAFGVRTRRATLIDTTPSRTRKRNSPRTAASLRRMVTG